MTILIFIAVLLFLIVGHEAGHFFAAKWLKMKVLEFGVGFPPKMFGKKFSPDGTEYSVNWIPFGGFVRIFGENEKEATDPIAFPNRPASHQALVLFAGPFANILLAVLLSALALSVGTLTVLDGNNTSAHLIDEPRVLIGAVLPDSPADKAGIRVGDEIQAMSTGFEAHLIGSPEEVSWRVSEAAGPITFTLVREGETQQISVEGISGLIESTPDVKAVGIATALVGTVSYPLHVALWRAVVDTVQNFVFILVSLGALIGSLFTFSADVSQLAGPVGIASLTGDAAALGLGALLSFAALLSINLAIINLLPFPALDGGRLLFLGFETLFRRKIPLQTAQIINFAGFSVLILLMLAITTQDIFRLVG